MIHAERLDGQQAVDVDEVDGEVELAQLFVSLQVLDFQDVVEGKVQVVQVAQTAQIFDLTDEVVLKVQDLKLGAQARERAVDALDVLLVQRYFLEVLRAERVSSFLCAPPVVFCAAGARNALSIARACSPRRMRTRVLSPLGICHCARHARAAASHQSAPSPAARGALLPMRCRGRLNRLAVAGGTKNPAQSKTRHSRTDRPPK